MADAKLPLTLAEQVACDLDAVGGCSELAAVVDVFALAGRKIADQIMRAGLLDQLGYTGEVNVQDEQVTALDMICNELMADAFQDQPLVSAMVSEEMADIHAFAGHQGGKYLVLLDPLDGSGNVDINGSMGTIFSVHERQRCGSPVTLEECLRKGSAQVAAGYILYGPTTLLVYSVGGPVHGFTLDRSTGNFLLTHANLRIPEGKGSFAVNEANASQWTDAVRAVVAGFKSGAIGDGRRSARYVGALVADFHRTMIQGGIYMYPGEFEKPEGKLRLLYEAAPLAFIAKHAGGHATDGHEDILDLEASELHQRTPLYIGGKGDVEAAMQVLGGGRPPA